MSVPVFMRRQMGALRPIDAASEAAVALVLHNEIVQVEIKRPRNLPHHRKWWKLVQVVFPHQSTYPTIEQFYDRAVYLICTRIIPRLGREDLMQEVGEILEGSGRRVA